MKVSVTLHRQAPDEDGNQRDQEARYGGYNRGYAELLIDGPSGAGLCEIQNMVFPVMQTDPEVLTHCSIGVCLAPPCMGGAIIIAGELEAPIDLKPGMAPHLRHFACAVNPAKLAKLGLVKSVNGQWVEKTEQELRNPNLETE